MSALLLAAVLTSTTAVDRVVVFPDRAQVVRVANVTCGARVPVVFEGVPPAAAGDSFRARLSDGSVDGLRAELKAREKEFGPKAQALKKQLDDLEKERNGLEDANNRAAAQNLLSERYAAVATSMISREMSLEQPNLRAWLAAVDSAVTTGLAAARQSADVDAKLRDVLRREDFLRRQLDEVTAASQRRSWSVEVLVSCPAGRTAELALTYLVGGASWTPAYEARADEANAAVDVSTWATIRQATGEDWGDVELVLSTAVPSQNATPPELKKLKVTTYERAPEKKVLVRRDEYVERAQVGQGGGEQAQGRLQARSQGLSVQLKVPEKGRVPGDGAPVRLFVGKSKLKAAFELRAMPKLHPVAFRVAELTNTGPWPLLPGRLDAFRPTGLVGRYELERVPQGGLFTLTFGVEDGVRVKRTVLEELKRDAGLFGGKKRFTYSYRFELANYGKAPLEVALADHLPVSELDDISVAVGEKTTPGYQLSPTDGIAKWKVSLKGQEKKTVTFSYRVDVPSTYETGGL